MAIDARRVRVCVGLEVLREVGTPRGHEALVVEHPDPLARIIERDCLLHNRGDNQVGNSCACGAGADEEEALILKLAAGDLEGAEQSRERDAGSALNVVVVATYGIAVTR